jgi:AAA ATPase-like protein
MLTGRTEELARIRKAILGRHSLLLCGPAGSGKSALLTETLSSLPGAVRRNCILCDESRSPRTIYQSLIRSMASCGDSEILSRVEGDAGSADQVERWLRAQSSLRLRGLLRKAARAHPYCIFFDTPTSIPDGIYRLFQDWVWSGRTPVILLARGASEHELGRFARLFWHSGLHLSLQPLEPRSAEELLEAAIAQCGLSPFADSAFREFVIKHSERWPGRIMQLCKMASNVSYHYAGRIKLHTLAVDFLLEQDATLHSVQRGAQHV